MATVTKATVDPIPRIEGHLGIKLEAEDGFVKEATAHGNMFRGFENFLIGRDPNDAITFTQRICGVCPVNHATAAANAVEATYGYSTGHITFSDEDNDGLGIPPKAVHIRNLILGAEFLMSSITHFYHLAAQSYVQGPAMPPWTPYLDTPYYNPLLLSGGRALPDLDPVTKRPTNLWSAVITQYVKALRMRRLTFEAGALFAGRMPMTSSYLAGGVTNQDSAVDFQEKCKKYYHLLHEVGEFVVKEYVPLALALGAVYSTYDNSHNTGLAGPGQNIGAGLGNFLSWGAFPIPGNNTLALNGGYKIAGQPVVTLVTRKRPANGQPGVQTMIDAVNANLIEDTHHTWCVANPDWGYPGVTATAQRPGAVTRTEPDRAKGNSSPKYSWTKAPRWRVVTKDPQGNDVIRYHAMEVGPLARMVVQGWYPVDGSLLRDHFNVGGGNLGYRDYLTWGEDPDWEPDPENSDAVAPIVPTGLNTAVIDAGLVSALSAQNLLTAVAGWIIGLRGGLSVMDRLRARALESLVLVQLILGPFAAGRFGTDPGTGVPTSGWIGAAAAAPVAGGRSYRQRPAPLNRRSNYGVAECPRGSLSHHLSIDKGRIAAYQCVVPTTWNASPKDNLGNLRGGHANVGDSTLGRGAMEQAMIGSPYLVNAVSPGVEAMRIAQSFDPCIACAVH